MSKYDVNNYHVIFFDNKGTKLFTENLDNFGLIKSREYADSRVKMHESVASYVILRVIDNSLD
jgi:hypothetical protein